MKQVRKKSPSKKPQGISFTPDLLSFAKVAAENEGRSLSGYVCNLVREDVTRRGLITPTR